MKHGVRGDLAVALVRWATTGRQETLTGTLRDIAQKAVANVFAAPCGRSILEKLWRCETSSLVRKAPLLGKKDCRYADKKQAGILSSKLRRWVA